MPESNDTRTIYGLVDPEAPDVLRYIGQTKKTPKVRLGEHVADAKRGQDNYRCRWIRSLIALGRKPEVVVVEIVTKATVAEAEKRLIAQHKATLTNTTAGGDGTLDMHPEAIARAKASRAWYRHSKETAAQISASKKGKFSERHRAALEATNKIPKTAEHMEALHNGRKQWKPDEVYRQKLSEGIQRSWGNGTRSVHENTLATCKKNSAAKRGVPLTEEHKAKVGAASKKAVRTEEWKASISEAIKKHWEKRRAARI